MGDAAPDLVREPDLARFDRVERVVHWVTATLFVAVDAAPARRSTSAPQPRWSAAASSCARCTCSPASRSRSRCSSRSSELGSRAAPRPRPHQPLDPGRPRWLRRRPRYARLGKFNPGQKLNATFLGAGDLVMLGTGTIMKWFDPFPIDWRTGATFVHDWVALGIWIAVDRPRRVRVARSGRARARCVAARSAPAGRARSAPAGTRRPPGSLRSGEAPR